MTTGTFIGEYRAGTGGDAVITNPATEQEVAAFTSSGVADVDEAAAAARAAQPEWAAKTPGERSLARRLRGPFGLCGACGRRRLVDVGDARRGERLSLIHI